MIYISSSCVRFGKISESVDYLANKGFKHIELSGGTRFYRQIENDLIELKEKYGLSYLLHNYFPPPEEPFVLNLASPDDRIFKQSIDHFLRAIELSSKLGSKKYGLHAGYFIDPQVSELGNRITKYGQLNKAEAVDRFCEGFQILTNKQNDIELYLENNVVSQMNFETYGDVPFMLTHFEDYIQLSKKINFKMIVDVAHLKVSCRTLQLGFEEEFNKFMNVSDYIHLSDNNGAEDQNKPFSNDSEIIKLLSLTDLNNKIFTIEIYDNIDRIVES
nr:sugar phosphate isomerase/epimerase [Bacteroidota bacterium]